MFTQNVPACLMCGQLDELLPGQNATSGGSSDTEVNEPDGEPDRLVVGCCGHDRHSRREVTEHLAEDGGIDVGRFSQRRRSTPPRR